MEVQSVPGAPPAPGNPTVHAMWQAEFDQHVEPIHGEPIQGVLSVATGLHVPLGLSFKSWVARLSSRKFQVVVTSDVAIAAGIISHLFPGQTGAIAATALTGLWVLIEGIADVAERYQVNRPTQSVYPYD